MKTNKEIKSTKGESIFDLHREALKRDCCADDPKEAHEYVQEQINNLK